MAVPCPRVLLLCLRRMKPTECSCRLQREFVCVCVGGGRRYHVCTYSFTSCPRISHLTGSFSTTSSISRVLTMYYTTLLFLLLELGCDSDSLQPCAKYSAWSGISPDRVSAGSHRPAAGKSYCRAQLDQWRCVNSYQHKRYPFWNESISYITFHYLFPCTHSLLPYLSTHSPAPNLRGVGIHTEHTRRGVWSGEACQTGQVQCGHNVQHDGRLVCLSTLHQERGQEGLPAQSWGEHHVVYIVLVKVLCMMILADLLLFNSFFLPPLLPLWITGQSEPSTVSLWQSESWWREDSCPREGGVCVYIYMSIEIMEYLSPHIVNVYMWVLSASINAFLSPYIHTCI